MILISNMYPSKKNPQYGAFVKNFEINCQSLGIKYKKIVMIKKEKKIIKLVSYILYYLKIIFHIIICKREEVFYIHYAAMNLLPFDFFLKIIKLKKIRLIINVHGTDVELPEHQKKYYKTNLKVFKSAERIVVPSSFFEKVLLEKYCEINNNKVSVLASGGIDSKVFYPYDKNKARLKKNMMSKKKIVGYVGRFDSGKGWDLLLELAPFFNDSIEFYFIGKGSQLQRIKNTAKNMENVTVLSSVNQKELNDYYNCFDVFCFPTELKESLGLVALEAMATKTLVIVSDSGAQKEYVKNGENGLVFKAGSKSELKDCLLTAIQIDDLEKEKIIKSAFSKSKEFSKSKVLVEMKKILRS